MIALVTGASGFVGSALVGALAAEGHRVVAVARRPPQMPCEGVSWVQADLRTYTGWAGLLAGVKTVYHLAWSSLPATSNQDPMADALDNIVGTLRLLEAAKTRPGIRLVFISSGGTVYGRLQTARAAETHPTRPTCAYGVSKLAVENYLEIYASLWGLDAIALRISNAYGAGQDTQRNFGVVTTFASRALAGKPIAIYGDGSVTRDYIYISDLVEALLAAGQMRGGGPVVNVGSGVGHSLNDVLQLVGAALGRKVTAEYLPGRDFDVPISVLDISRAREVLSWVPKVPLSDGIALTLGGFRRGG